MGYSRLNRVYRLLASAFAILAITPISSAQAESQHDLLLFASVEGFDNLADPVDGLKNSYVRPTADILHTYNNGRFRFLGEYIWSSSESEVERLKLGWQVSDQTMIWLGRMHTAAKYWTTAFHHGQFMQTAISRPGLEEWEDESGPLPSHITGLSIEHERVLADQSAWRYTLSAGFGPKFQSNELVPFDLLDPSGGFGLSINFRLSYQPDFSSGSEVGLLLGWNDIEWDDSDTTLLPGLKTIDQLSAGFYVDWSSKSWRVLSSWMYIRNEFRGAESSPLDEFVLGYLQGEYRFANDWTGFARTEIGFSEDRSLFLRWLPHYVAHRHMLGLRWDFADKHALTMEVADTSRQGNDFRHHSFKELRFQWSAVFP